MDFSQVYKIYAFTYFHVASGDSSVSAPLSVCGDSGREERFFSIFFLSLFALRLCCLSTSGPTDIALCVRVCLASAVCSTGGLEGGVKREEC